MGTAINTKYQLLNTNRQLLTPRLHRQGMEGRSHVTAKRRIDHLMLLDAGFACKCRAFDDDFPMVIIAREVFEGNFRIRQRGLNTVFDFSFSHGHRMVVLEGSGDVKR